MKKTTKPKPPVGLRPKHVLNELRAIEILEAMTRYVNAGKCIPNEWINELDNLNAFMR